MRVQKVTGSERGSARVAVVRFGPGRDPERSQDRVATEEPLEIRVAVGRGTDEVLRPLSVTMRTPGHDVELSVGFLFAEGVITTRDAVREVAHCARTGARSPNVVEVRLAPDVAVDPIHFERNFYVSSSCGVCGKASLEAVESRGMQPLPLGEVCVQPDMISALPDVLRASQGLFERTGGLHAAGLFDADGTLLVAREDVGRHNAVDKVVGHALLGGVIALDRAVLVVSGRSSFEILQKAVTARIPMVVAVGAPSSLAVSTARRFNVTLIGFARDGGFNVYAAEERLR